jgi:hypothetical protein
VGFDEGDDGGEAFGIEVLIFGGFAGIGFLSGGEIVAVGVEEESWFVDAPVFWSDG